MNLPFFEYPIVLAPMGGVATIELVVAVCEAGGFGLLPCAYLSPEQIASQIAGVREGTNRPFGVNLFVEQLPFVGDAAASAASHERLRAYRDELGIPQPASPALPPEHYQGQVDAIIDVRPDVFTFTFGIPDATTMERFRSAGIFTMGTATSVPEALALKDAGVDGVFAQGSEAGAHRGTFLTPVPESPIGTLALVPQVVDATGLPVFAAGGIGDGRGVAAVLALGATAAALGTSFLLAMEAGTAKAYREILGSSRAVDTVLTRVFSGRTARGVRNRATVELRDPEDIAPYPFQNAMTRDIRNAAAAQGNPEFLSLWAGQAAALAREAPAREIVQTLIRDAQSALDRIHLQRRPGSQEFAENS